MKKISLYFMISILCLIAFPTLVCASTGEPTPSTNAPKEVPAEVKVLLHRLDEINALDKSTLKPEEKKALRKEVRVIKKTLRSTGNGIYLSVGAIIIIILLLIILL